MSAILNSVILISTNLDSAILVFSLKLTHTCQDWFQQFAQKKKFTHTSFLTICTKNFTHSFRLNFLMVDILNSAMNSAILNSAILDSASDDGILDLNSARHLVSDIFFSDSLKNTLTPLWLWLKLIQSDSNSFILTQLDDGQPSWILPYWILPSWIQLLIVESLFSSLRFTQKHSHSTLALTQTNLIQTHILTQLNDGGHLEFDLDSGILVFPLKPTHICQDWFTFAQKSFTHSFSLTLMMAAILNSAMFDSDADMLDSNTLLSSLSYTQKHSHSTLTLTQTNSIWLKLFHSHLNWWWQPSWILPSWIPPS